MDALDATIRRNLESDPVHAKRLREVMLSQLKNIGRAGMYESLKIDLGCSHQLAYRVRDAACAVARFKVKP